MKDLTLTLTRQDAIVLSFAATASLEKLEEISKKYGDAIDYTVNAYRPVLEKFKKEISDYLNAEKESGKP